MRTLAWMGPVQAANLAGAVPEGWRLIVINQGEGGGIGSSAFAALGESISTAPLDALLEPLDDDPCVLVAFSAGHGLLEVILRKQGQDARIKCAMACDAYYLSHEALAAGATKPGFLAYGQLAAAATGPPLGFTSSSHAGPTHPSSSASLVPLASALGLSTEPPRHTTTLPAPPSPPRWRGRALWLDYGAQFGHVEHATKLAPAMVRAFFDGRPELAGAGSSSSGDGVALLAAGAAAGYALGWFD